MNQSELNPTLLEEGLGALSIAGCILSSPLTRPWYSKWGATDGEVARNLPGDDLAPEPFLESTRAITINAAEEQIWPWLLQLGQGRGGFYSYQRLENLAGCQIHNADQIVPELQELKVGDLVRLGPEGYPAFSVAEIDPGRALMLRGDMPDAQGYPTTWIWLFYLEPVGDNRTRLLLRSRLVCQPSLGNKLTWRVFTDPIAFNMERKMLQGIKARAEK